MPPHPVQDLPCVRKGLRCTTTQERVVLSRWPAVPALPVLQTVEEPACDWEHPCGHAPVVCCHLLLWSFFSEDEKGTVIIVPGVMCWSNLHKWCPFNSFVDVWGNAAEDTYSWCLQETCQDVSGAGCNPQLDWMAIKKASNAEQGKERHSRGRYAGRLTGYSVYFPFECVCIIPTIACDVLPYSEYVYCKSIYIVGYSAKHGSYTMMDVQASEIVDIQLVQVFEIIRTNSIHHMHTHK